MKNNQRTMENNLNTIAITHVNAVEKRLQEVQEDFDKARAVASRCIGYITTQLEVELQAGRWSDALRTVEILLYFTKDREYSESVSKWRNEWDAMKRELLELIANNG